MKTDQLKVAYLCRVSTRKDGNTTIYSKTLRKVLEGQLAMNKPEKKVFENEADARKYKSSNPGIFPVALNYDSAKYTDDVFKHGHMVFIDIDTTILADEVFKRMDELKTLMPSLVAVWYSLRNKLHFAFLCPWQERLEYAANWKLISDEFISHVGDVFGNDAAKCWSKSNDKSLSSCMHLLSAGYTKGFKWYDEAEFFEAEAEEKQENMQKLEYRNIPLVKPDSNSLFVDEEVKQRWKKSNSVGSFVKWCEKNRDYKYHTQDKDYDYKVEIVDDVQYHVWRNDGTVHVLKTFKGFKLTDYRKRHIEAAAIMAICFCNASFEETLYSVSKFYVENCEEYSARENEKGIIMERVESVYANKVRYIKKCESNNLLMENRKVVIGDRYANGNDFPVYRDEKHTVSAAVKKSDRQKRFVELYQEGDTTAVMTMKLRSGGYPKISEQVTYKVGVSCGIVMDKPENKYRGRYDYGNRYSGKYRNAYDKNGKRSMVMVEKIDNVNWFASKKALGEAERRELSECLSNYNTTSDWMSVFE